ncbi:13200_t:CDS:10 [Acaulospora colombiana]|uniref:13200_t:CDS:1 n=1 Tax=Acaulospora colombiana TaxID=27376 RepID=A0ACA9LD96_9GLOM|nr:13200_t:CDS:10 [Acaulospora colombiana]
MPLLTLDKDLRFFYNIFSPKGSVLDASKPIILFVHPIFFDQTFFAPQYTDERLVERYNLVSRSSNPAWSTQTTLDDEKYDFDKVVRDIFRFLDALEIEKCHLLGVAIGATLAVRMAMLHAERVLSLTLCSMGPPAPTADWVEQHKAILETVLDGGDMTFEDVVSAGLKTYFGEKNANEEDAKNYVAANPNMSNKRQLTKVYSSHFDQTAPPESDWKRIKIPLALYTIAVRWPIFMVETDQYNTDDYKTTAKASTGSVLDASKPIVLFLHPMFFDQTFFTPQYTEEGLVERYNLILLDHHYHGGTQTTLDDEKYDFDKVIRDIFRFLDALEIEKCHLLGVATGATLAVRMAMLHIERTADWVEQHKAIMETVLDGGDMTFEEVVRDRLARYFPNRTYHGLTISLALTTGHKDLADPMQSKGSETVEEESRSKGWFVWSEAPGLSSDPPFSDVSEWTEFETNVWEANTTEGSASSALPTRWAPSNRIAGTLIKQSRKLPYAVYLKSNPIVIVMPLLTIDQDLRFFYNIFSPKGSLLDASKPTILFLHPVFFDQGFFAPQYTDEGLIERYNLILLDHHYHGGTQNTLDDEKYDFDMVIRDIFRFLDTLEIEKCHILGVATGAVLAVRMAMMHVERVLSLTLCSMGPPAPTAEFIQQHMAILELAINKGDNTLEEIVSAGFKSLFGPKRTAHLYLQERAFGFGASLSPEYGLGIDNAVQFEIVTPDGELRTANAYQHKDLFWASRGGGPQDPTLQSLVVWLSFSLNYTSPSYRNPLRIYLLLQPDLSARNFSGYTFSTISLSGDNSGTNAGAGILGSILLPASLFPEGSVDDLVDFLMQAPFSSVFHLVTGKKVARVTSDATAVHPAWRRPIHHLVLTTGWDTNIMFPERRRRRDQIMEQTQKLTALVPDSGCYVNDMPLVTVDQDLRFFYNVFSPKGSILDTSKPVILLLHPTFFDQTFFAPQYTDEELAEKYNLIVLDHHYHGGTQVTLDDGKYDFDKNPDDIAKHRALLELTLEAEDDYADALPDMVSAGMKTLFGRKGQPEEEQQRWMATNQITPMNKQLLRKVYSSIFDRTAPPSDAWQRIKIPVLIAHGEADIPYPPSIAKANWELFSEATTREVQIIRCQRSFSILGCPKHRNLSHIGRLVGCAPGGPDGHPTSGEDPQSAVMFYATTCRVLEAILAGEDGTDELPSNIIAAGRALLFGKKGRTATSKFVPSNRKLFKKVYSAILDRQPPPASEWKKIKMPVLLVHAENYDLLSEASNKEIIILDNAAHLFTWPEAERVNPMIAKYLQQYPATA